MTESGLSIGQVAERTGLSVHALRFYEREGIFTGPVRRGAGGRRVYGEQEVDWLLHCLVLRGSGMPLPALREYAGLVKEGPGNERSRIALLRDHERRVTEQITQLNQCLDLLAYKVGAYEDILDGRGDE